MKVVNLSEQEIRDLLELINLSDNKCYDGVARKLSRRPIYETVLRAIDGHFGRRVLKPQYRALWRVLTYGTLLVAALKCVIIPFLEGWGKVVTLLNCVVWG